jgi:hypothetical protein
MGRAKKQPGLIDGLGSAPAVAGVLVTESEAARLLAALRSAESFGEYASMCFAGMGGKHGQGQR